MKTAVKKLSDEGIERFYEFIPERGVSFEFILENCKTTGDIQKLTQEFKNGN